MKKYLLTGGFAAMLLLGACGSEESSDQAEAETEEATEEETEESTEEKTTEESLEEEETVETDENSSEAKEMEDGEYEIQMAKVKITNTEILPPGEYTETDQNRIAIYYEVTSKVTPEEAGEVEVSPMSVWMASMSATQETADTIKTLEIGSSFEDKFQEYNDSQMDVIKKGKTVKGVAVYMLENRDNPVILKATQGLGGQDLGEYEIDVTE